MSNEAPNSEHQSTRSSDIRERYNESNSDSGNRPTGVDRRKLAGGISEGGRRKLDRVVVKPVSRASRIWFGLSVAITLMIMGWTVYIPFKSEKPIFAWDKSDLPARVNPISREILEHPEHAMSDDQYKDHIYVIESNLQEELRIRNEVPANLPNTQDAKVTAERRIGQLKGEMEYLTGLEGKHEKGFAVGSIEFKAMDNLRKKLEASDELLPKQ